MLQNAKEFEHFAMESNDTGRAITGQRRFIMPTIANKEPVGVDAKFAELVLAYTEAMNEGRIADAQEASNAVMAEALRQAQESPTPKLLRSVLADQAVNDGEWEVARQIYLEELAEANAEATALVRGCRQSLTKLRLARIEQWEGKHDQAYETARTGVSMARTADMPLHLAIVLTAFTEYAIKLGRVDEALQAANEGLGLLDDSQAYNHSRANLLLCRVTALLQTNRIKEARSSHELAWEKLAPLTVMVDAAGVQATLATWWHLDAEFKNKEANWPMARDSWENAVALQRHVAKLWDDRERRLNVRLAETLGAYADAAELAGVSERAMELRAERDSVLSRNPKSSDVHP